MSEVNITAPVTKSSIRERRREFCLWVVPPNSGKVKKLRLKGWMLLVALSLSLIFFSGVGVLVTDYARIQFLRAKNYLFLKAITHERDQLKNKNNQLQGEVAKLKSNVGRVEAYEKNVRQRLEELASVIGSMKALGVLGGEEHAAPLTAPGVKAKFSEDGIGGAEVPCEEGMLNCSNLKLEGDQIGESFAESVLRPFEDFASVASRAFNVNSEEDVDAQNNLVHLLDQYIENLKVVPFGLPASGNVSSDFGYRRSPFTNNRTLHEGIDFSMPQGSQILTTGDGLVKEVRWHPTYGLMIDIEHTPSVVTRYAHLRKAFVSEGEKVCRGDIIGLAGTSGRSTGPHLHYEVRIGGEPRNPKDIIALGERLAAVL